MSDPLNILFLDNTKNDCTFSVLYMNCVFESVDYSWILVGQKLASINASTKKIQVLQGGEDKEDG